MLSKKIKVIIGEKNLLIGGTQRLAVDQLNLLDPKIFDLYLVTLFQVPDKGDFYHLIPPHVTVYKLHFRSGRDVRGWWELIKILYRVRPHIVKTSGFLGNSIFRTLKFLFWYKVVVAEHNTNIQRSRLQKFLNKFFSLFTYTIVGDSNMVVDELSKNNGIDKNKFTVIYNGVDIVAINDAKKKYVNQREILRSELGIAHDDFVFLTVARLLKQKDHALMVDSFQKLLQLTDGKKVKLVLVGDGVPEMRSALEAQIKRYGLQNEIILTGEQKYIMPYYAMSDAFLLTSLHEGFCIAAMQGLAFGLPLISTKVAGVIEYLKDGENGFFVERDANNIAEKCYQLMSLSSGRFNDLKNGAVNSAQEYSLEKYGKAYNTLFKKMTRQDLN